MDRDEILRLKQITGLAALFKDVNFGEAWRPVEDEFYQNKPLAACEEVNDDEKSIAEGSILNTCAKLTNN